MFLFELSMTLCLVYKKKCSDQSSDTIRGATKDKLSTCSLRWDPSDICTKTQMSFLNQTRQSERSLHSICPDDRLKSVDCVKANSHLYTVSSVGKIAAVIVISIIFFAFDATRHSHSAKSSVSR